MSKETTYPIGDGAHHRRGQYQAARPPKQTPARDTLPTTPPPGPAWTRSAKVAATRELIAEINKAADQRNALLASLFPILRDAQHLQPSTAQVDPASFRHQRDQAQAAIRELLALYDAQAAEIATMTEDIHTLIIAVMYGDPPGGWNKERGAEFSAEIQAAIGRQQDRRQVMQP